MLLINNTNTDPYFNLALEEYIFDNFKDDVLMLWQNDNTIVVGKNQNTLGEIDYDYVKANNIKVVRRMSGGGAVFHDMGNLNFTFTSINANDSFFDFKKFTLPVVTLLNDLGVHAELSGRNDLIINGRKFSGNAQYVKNNRVLHHGTLLFSSTLNDISSALKVDPEKISSKGIKSVASRVTNISEHLTQSMDILQFKNMFIEHILKNADVSLYTLTPDDIAAAQKLAKDKYSTWEWNFGYSPKYAFHKKARFNAGTVEVNIDVKDGIISDIKFFGDFFAKHSTSAIEELLKGRKHNLETMSQILDTVNLNDYFLNISKDDLISVLI